MMGPVKTWSSWTQQSAAGTLLARRTAAAAVGAAALALSGCAGGGLDTAATINGQVISERDLQATLLQLQPVLPTEPGALLNTLARGPVLDAKAVGQGFELSQEEIVASIRGQAGIEEPEPLLIDYVRYDFYSRNLESAGQSPTPEELAGLDVQINPRYGQWDPASAQVAPALPDWITPATPDAGS